MGEEEGKVKIKIKEKKKRIKVLPRKSWRVELNVEGFGRRSLDLGVFEIPCLPIDFKGIVDPRHGIGPCPELLELLLLKLLLQLLVLL